MRTRFLANAMTSLLIMTLSIGALAETESVRAYQVSIESLKLPRKADETFEARKTKITQLLHQLDDMPESLSDDELVELGEMSSYLALISKMKSNRDCSKTARKLKRLSVAPGVETSENTNAYTSITEIMSPLCKR